MHILVLVLLSFLFVAAAPAQTDNEPSSYTLRVTVERLNIRPKMTTRYNEMTQAEAGEILSGVSKIGNWHRILPPPGTFCYVLADNVELLSSARGVVRDDVVSLPVRLGSNTSPTSPDSAEVLAELNAGDRVEIIVRDGDWYRIRPPKGVYAYVMNGDDSGDFVEVVNGTPIEEANDFEREERTIQPRERDEELEELEDTNPPQIERAPILEQPPVRVVETAPPIRSEPQVKEPAQPEPSRTERWQPLPRIETTPQVDRTEEPEEQDDTPVYKDDDSPADTNGAIVELQPVQPTAPLSGSALAQRELQTAARILPPRSTNGANSDGVFEMEPVNGDSRISRPTQTATREPAQPKWQPRTTPQESRPSTVVVSQPLEIKPMSSYEQPVETTTSPVVVNDFSTATTMTEESAPVAQPPSIASPQTTYAATWMEKFYNVERSLPLELQKDPLARDWRGFLAQLRPIATQSQEPEAARVARIRIRTLEKRVSDQDFLRRSASAIQSTRTVATTASYRAKPQTQQPALAADAVASFFDARGVLITEPTEKELERLRRPRLIDPQTGAVTAYIDINGLNFDQYENKMVGARGTVWYDAQLGGRIIKVDHYQVINDNGLRYTQR